MSSKSAILYIFRVVVRNMFYECPPQDVCKIFPAYMHYLSANFQSNISSGYQDTAVDMRTNGREWADGQLSR